MAYLNFSFIGILFLLVSCQSSVKKFENRFLEQSDTAVLLKDSVMVLSDARDTIGLLELLDSDNNYALLYVSQAASSIQSKYLSEALLQGVETPFVNIRRSIYFALGQTKDLERSELLLSFLLNEEDSIARVYLLEAIGKSGDKSLIHDLDTMVFTGADAHGLALAYYRYSQRNIISNLSNERMIAFLSSAYASETRHIASNFLARLRGTDLIKYIEILNQSATNDTDPVVRMNIMTAFNKTNSQNIKNILLTTATNSQEDYRIRVNAINTLNYYQYDGVAPLLTKILLEKNEILNVRLECAAYFLNRLKRTEYNLLIKSINELKYDLPLIESKILAAILKLAKDEDAELLTRYVQQRINETPNGFYRSMLVSALGSHVSNFKVLPNYIFYDSSLLVNSAAMHSFFELSQKENFMVLTRSCDESTSELINFFATTFKNAILSGDPTLMGYGAKGLRNAEVDYLEAINNLDFISLAKQNLDLPKDVETLIELEKTESFIDEQTYTDVAPPVNNPIDLKKIKQQESIHFATVNTRKGSFTIKFNKHAAPATVANFIELSQSGFFNNLFFHRVENNFVVQGGCPRGDGWGSSGKSIRSEFGQTYFKTGSVGMASAGKDTESCQWFVTHYPSSHLDGSFTNFADVIEGMNVVHSLAVGDSILSIKLN